jgi:hypothetical protein
MTDPFAGLSHQEIYKRLTSGTPGLPQWPDEKTQAGYAGTNGPGLVRRSLAFVDMLKNDGAFAPGWKGLDYACGWGRFASLLLSHGTPEQLDLADAWPVTLKLLERGGFKNRVSHVSELLTETDLPPSTYDFAFSFSLFTHLNHEAFTHNIGALRKALRPRGTLYITVRHDEFLAHRYPGDVWAHDVLADRQFLFRPTQGDMTGAALFGDMIVTRQFVESLGPARYLGKPHDLQHVYALSWD